MAGRSSGEGSGASPTPRSAPATLFDPPPVIPDRAKPSRLATMIATPRPQMRLLAEAEQVGLGHGNDWIGYSLHLLDVIAGYELAVANLTEPPSSSDVGADNARKLAPSLVGRRGVILRHLATFPDGLTCHDVEVALEWNHGSASARWHELRKLGWIAATGERRTTTIGPRGEFKAEVYRITPMGVDALNQTEGSAR